MGPTSVAGGVVFAGSTAPAGSNMFALSGASGRILWRFASGGSVVSSPAIANGTVYWGSGDALLSALGYTGNDKP
jgi:polyvinyl alcohol dehydrogenase (cytochrome)